MFAGFKMPSQVQRLSGAYAVVISVTLTKRLPRWNPVAIELSHSLNFLLCLD